MLDLSLKNYVDWRVAQVIPVRSGFGYRVFLRYPDGSEKPQQKSGFKTEKEANKAREKTIAELYNGTFVVYAKVNVADFMSFWLEEELKKRTDSHETYYNYCGIVKNHIVPILGKKKMMDVTRGDIQKLFNTKTDYSRSVAETGKNNHECLFSLCGNNQSDSKQSSRRDRASQSRKAAAEIRIQDPEY